MSLNKNNTKIEITPDRVHIQVALELIRKYNNGEKVKLLDVGSGDNILKHHLPHKIEYYSLELPDKELEDKFEDERGYKYDFVLDLDKKKIPIGDNFFDIIVCLDVLEHTIFPENIIKELKRITKDKGLFIISLPNEYNFLHRLYYLFAIKTYSEISWRVVFLHQHIQKPRVKDIIDLMLSNFELLQVKYNWHSRMSYHGRFFFMLDKLFNGLAQIHPSLFARDVVAVCKNKK